MVTAQKKGMYASDEPPRFFKVYLPHSFERLRIPPAFIEHFNGEIPIKAILRSRIGRSWCVVLKKYEKDMVFQTGWQSFVKDYPLDFGDFLVFSYCGHSEFYVKVFSRNGCEKKEALACSTCKKTPTTSLKEAEPGDKEALSKGTHGLKRSYLRNPKVNGRANSIPDISESAQPKSSIPVDLGEERVFKAAKSVDPQNTHFTASVRISSPSILRETKDKEVPDHGHRPQCEQTSIEKPTIEETRPLKTVNWEHAKWKLRTGKDGSSYLDMEEDTSSEFSFASSSFYRSHDKKGGQETTSSEEYQNLEVLSNLERRCKGKIIRGKSSKTSGKKSIIRELENLNWGINYKRTKGATSSRRYLKKWGWNGTWRISS